MEVWYHVYTNDGTPNFGFAIQFYEKVGWCVTKSPPNPSSLVAKIYHQNLINKGYEVVKVITNGNKENNSSF